MNRPPSPPQPTIATLALGLILAFYACARILEIAPNALPRTAIVALDVLSAMTFALFDGYRHYRLRGILVFAVICAIVGNITENLGVVTGLPFGRYYFVELMGPKLFHVPVLLGLAYIGMAYVSWTLARLIVGNRSVAVAGTQVFTVPLAASFIMVAWDLAQDPVWATELHGWVWLDGGPWFGVPVSNYFGWFGNVLIIYQLFAFYLRRVPDRAAQADQAGWRPAIFF
jgi:putative membrane protein